MILTGELTNPAKDLLNVDISLSKETHATITIENMLGQVVYTKQTSQNLNQLNISTCEWSLFCEGKVK